MAAHNRESPLPTKRLFPLGSAAFWLALFVAADAGVQGQVHTRFSPDPDHPWNLLHADLFTSVSLAQPAGPPSGAPGAADSETMSESPARLQHVRQELQRFLSRRDDCLINDSLRRAIMQHDLWAVFDWTAQSTFRDAPGQQEVLRDLARLIQRLALNAQQIAALPDNYQAAFHAGEFPANYDPESHKPFLPGDLFQQQGPWVMLGEEKETQPVALQHVKAFDGRSFFTVHLLVPGGYETTRDYLKRLRDFPQPWVTEPGYAIAPGSITALKLNPRLPQIPVGTLVALVRHILLMDDQAHIVAGPLIESIQIRVYNKVPAVDATDVESQTSFEFLLDRTRLFESEAGGLTLLGAAKHGMVDLVPVPIPTPPEASPIVFGTINDPHSCIACHVQSGIFGILSYHRQFGPHTLDPPRLCPKNTIAGEQRLTVQWKQDRSTWGLLRGLWLATGPSAPQSKNAGDR